jgi:hypothetical protein
VTVAVEIRESDHSRATTRDGVEPLFVAGFLGVGLAVAAGGRDQQRALAIAVLTAVAILDPPLDHTVTTGRGHAGVQTFVVLLVVAVVADLGRLHHPIATGRERARARTIVGVVGVAIVTGLTWPYHTIATALQHAIGTTGGIVAVVDAEVTLLALVEIPVAAMRARAGIRPTVSDQAQLAFCAIGIALASTAPVPGSPLGVELRDPEPQRRCRHTGITAERSGLGSATEE